jgi:tetratricopeptide (TPR) repeat protein
MAATIAISLMVFASSAHPRSLQDQSAEEAAAYKAWYDATTAKDFAKELELGKAFLAKFPNNKNAAYVKGSVARARGQLFNTALQAKNVNEMIRLANEALAEDPNNLDYLYLLAYNIRSIELEANPPNFSHANELADYTRRAMALIEQGKVPSGVDKTKWNQNSALGYLQQTIGRIEANNKNVDKALEAYKKASTLEPTNAYNFFACGQLYQGKYAAAVQKYQAIPEADRTAAEPKPEVKAALDEVNNNADAVIDCWARFLGLTAVKNPFGAVRGEVEKVLVELYKFRHPDSPDGLQKLIDQYKATTSALRSPKSMAASAQIA